MSYKKGNTNAFLLGMKFGAGMAEAQYIASVQHAIDDETFKKDGFKTAEEFIVDGQRFTSYDSFRKRSSLMKQLGVELTSVLLDAGFTWNRMRAIEHLLPADAKDAARNKDIIPINGKEVALQNKELLVTEIKLLQERHDNAAHKLKSAEKKLAGIDKETKKSEKPLLEKIAQLEAIMNPETPEKLEEAFLALDKMLEDFDSALRVLVWKQPWVKEDPAAQAKVEGLQARAENRFESFRGDWDAFVNSD